MLKNWDTILVGIATFVIVAIILAVRPGYTPIEVSDEVLNPPVAVQEQDNDDAEVEAVETEEPQEADAAATEEAETPATEEAE